jgi:filamentous hemagglutinin
VYNFQVEDYHTYYVGENSILVHNDCPESGSNAQGNGVPVKEKTTASNGLDYQSNPKHSPGQPGNRPNAGVEPRNSLDLFDKSVSSKSKPNQRFTFDTETNTVHRFYNDGNGVWHWSGSTNQGANSLTGIQVPNDTKNILNLPKKGW